MKKLLALTVTLVFVLALSACSLSADSGGTGGGQQSSGSNIAETQSTESNAQSSEEKIQSQPTESAANGQQGSSGDTASIQSTPSAQNPATAISRDEAINIALKQAGVTKDAVRDLEAELDRERSIVVWEVDFESGNMEYSYDINAQTGAVTERDKEFD